MYGPHAGYGPHVGFGGPPHGGFVGPHVGMGGPYGPHGPHRPHGDVICCSVYQIWIIAINQMCSNKYL